MKNVWLIVMASIVLLVSAGSGFADHGQQEKSQISLDQSETGQQQESERQTIFIVSADIFNSVVQIAHLIFHSDLFSEFELPEISETNAHSVIETALNFTKHYRTLFQIIIAPNAP